jgi:hypothetical protein
VDYAQAFARLRNHANIPDSAADLPESASFLYLLSQADCTKESLDFAAAYDDMVECLVTLNRALNTEQPSEHIEGKAPSVDRTLVYCMALIMSDGFSLYSRWASDGLFSVAYLSDLQKALLCIGFAWNAVLAGDIDDIREDIQNELLAFSL